MLLKKDTALFYKTKDLYYVKSETIYKDFCFELEAFFLILILLY